MLADNRTDKAARDFMSASQRDALADDYASRKQFLSASHFHSDAKKSAEFKKSFWENLTQKVIEV